MIKGERCWVMEKKKVSDSPPVGRTAQGGRLIDRGVDAGEHRNAELLTDLTERLIQKEIISFVEKVHNCGAVSLNTMSVR